MALQPTPGAVLDYWIGPATHDHLAATRLHKRWFIKSAETDAFIQAQFGDLLDALGGGLAERWAAAGARQSLAAIIVLDQFSRNIHRGKPNSFAYDALALSLAKRGIARGDLTALTEVEASFYLMPLEHSELLDDQEACIRQFEALALTSRAAFCPLIENSLDYAIQHRDIILRFGRFPHRNSILGRESTPEESAFLTQPGSGF